MIPEIRKINIYLRQLEQDLEVLIKQAEALKQENESLKQQLSHYTNPK